jgi:hypothetical protein
MERMNEISIKYNEEFVQNSIEKYGCTYSNLVVKSTIVSEYVITIGYGEVEGKKSSVLRYRVRNFNTLEEILFEGNVYNTDFCEGLTFDDVIKKAVKSLEYNFKKLSALC